MKIVIIILLAVSIRLSYGQINPSFEHYYLNNFIVNPAATGSNYYPVINISAKKQWFQVDNSPGTQLFCANLRLGRYDFYSPHMLLKRSRNRNREQIGLGIGLYNDRNGPQNNSGILLSYAYHVPVEFNQLSFGISASLKQFKLNGSELIPVQADDPEINGANESVIIPNANIGMYFYGDLFFFGAAVNDLFRNKDFYNNEYDVSQDYFLHLGYKQRLNKNFSLESSVAYKKNGNIPYSFDITAQLFVSGYNWLMVTYNTTNTLQCMLGVKVSRYLSIGYAYGSYFGILTAGYGNSHMLVVGRNLGLRNISGLQKLR